MSPTRQLTPAQQRVLALLSAGSTATAAAQFVGVHRNTAWNWLRSTAFRDALIEPAATRTSLGANKPGRSRARRSAQSRPSWPILRPPPPCASMPRSRSKDARTPNRPRNRTPNPPSRSPSANPAATSPALAAAGGNSSVAACRFIDSKGHNWLCSDKIACGPNVPLMHKSAQLRTKMPNLPAASAPVADSCGVSIPTGGLGNGRVAWTPSARRFRGAPAWGVTGRPGRPAAAHGAAR